MLLELALAADGGIGIDYYLVLRDDACGVSRRMMTSSGAASYTYTLGPTPWTVRFGFSRASVRKCFFV